MSEKTKFWILLTVFMASLILLVYLNYTDQRLFIGP
jgi:hypothetical protein